MKKIILTCSGILLLFISCHDFNNIYDPYADLVAYYPFDGDAKNAVAYTGNGIPSGGAELTVDRNGAENSAYSFDGDAAAISVLSSDAICIQDELTLTAWVCLEGNENSYGRIVVKEEGSSAPFISYALESNVDGENRFGFYISTTEDSMTYISADDSHALNTWYFVAGVWNGSSMSLYIDGIKQTETAETSGEIVYTSKVLDIGGNVVRGNQYLEGAIDDVRIYKRALNASEILAIYNGTDVVTNINSGGDPGDAAGGGTSKLLASDGAESDTFGSSADISGDYAVIGARNDDGKGSAYIFFNNGAGWSEQQKLTASDGASGDTFGGSSAISGDYAVVGAYRNSGAGSTAGAAYIFQRSGTGWSQQVKLTGSDTVDGDTFGYSVDISGNYMIAGAQGDDNVGQNSGSAYIFFNNGSSWNQQAKLTPSDEADLDCFGRSVAISDEYAVIGAYQDDDMGAQSGSVYVFQRSGTTWTQVKKLTASDGTASDNFGIDVGISGSYIIVGVFVNGDNAESAYIYYNNGSDWVQQDKLKADDTASGDIFGQYVSIDGDYALVGAYGNDDMGSNSGSAYIFQRSGTSWNQHSKLLADDGSEGDGFGFAVGIGNGKALIGAYSDDDSALNAGSAYIFVID